MSDYKKFFRGKKITVMGLGLLGRALNVSAFLAECGAELIVTDLKTKKQLAPSLQKLAKYTGIQYVLGGHRLEDFRNRDMILKGAGVPLDSPYIKEARKCTIPIEMAASLFTKLAPRGVVVIGITGTRGKTTTTLLLFEILKRAFGAGHVFLGGNIRDTATLPLLKKVKAGDYVVLELDSWQLQGFGDNKLSPHVAVFTTFYPDHMNYYKGRMATYFKDKAHIFTYQKKGDVFVVGEEVVGRVRKYRPKGKLVIASSADFPATWSTRIIGEHNRLNMACARAAARAVGVPDATIKKAVAAFKGVEGRLQFLRSVRGVDIYNDNNATTAEATIAALRAVEKDRNVILIIGGTDKGLDMSGLVREIGKRCKAVVMLKETGTQRIKKDIIALSDAVSFEEDGLKRSLTRALQQAKKGDVILFSPAFASFGKWFKNEYDRNDQFVAAVKKLHSGVNT